jgi:hypothetical protein
MASLLLIKSEITLNPVKQSFLDEIESSIMLKKVLCKYSLCEKGQLDLADMPFSQMKLK